MSDKPVAWDLGRLQKLVLHTPWFRSPHADGAGAGRTQWDVKGPDGSEDCFALFGYIPVRYAHSDDDQYVNRLVLDFKEGKAAAIDAVIAIATANLWRLGAETSITEEILELPGFLPYGTAIAVPSSRVGAGSVGINQLINALTSPAQRKSTDDTFVIAGDEVLYRHTALETPSHKVKKTMDEHLQTIRLQPKAGARLQEPDRTTRYVIFDDVFTRGETFGACKALIRAAHPQAQVRGFFIARTWASNK